MFITNKITIGGGASQTINDSWRTTVKGLHFYGDAKLVNGVLTVAKGSVTVSNDDEPTSSIQATGSGGICPTFELASMTDHSARNELIVDADGGKFIKRVTVSGNSVTLDPTPTETDLSAEEVSAILELQMYAPSEVESDCPLGIEYAVSEHKTDWAATDYFNIEDWGRIAVGMEVAHAFIESLFAPFDIDAFVDSKTYSDMIYASEFNALENALDTINDASYKLDIGSKKTFAPNGKTIDYNELNRLETALKSVMEIAVNHKANLPKLPIVLGGNNFIR